MGKKFNIFLCRIRQKVRKSFRKNHSSPLNEWTKRLKFVMVEQSYQNKGLILNGKQVQKYFKPTKWRFWVCYIKKNLCDPSCWTKAWVNLYILHSSQSLKMYSFNIYICLRWPRMKGCLLQGLSLQGPLL